MIAKNTKVKIMFKADKEKNVLSKFDLQLPEINFCLKDEIKIYIQRLKRS